MRLKKEDENINSCKGITDDGEKLEWIPIEEIEHSPIKPAFIKDNIKKIINERQIIHIIEERDKT